jgi:hypothetical protein
MPDLDDVPAEVEQDWEFYSRPQFEQLADGSWRARYPVADWSVTAETRQAAVETLIAEDLRKVKEDPGYSVRKFKALHRHLIEPIPGVYAITREQGERARASGDPQAEFERIANEIDAQNGYRSTT